MTTVIGGDSWENETGYALALQTDGKVLLVESNDASGTREVVLARYMAVDTAETWDMTPDAFSFTDVTGATTSSVSGLTGGIYSVTATDANGCFTVTSMTLTEPTVPTGMKAGVSIRPLRVCIVPRRASVS